MGAGILRALVVADAGNEPVPGVVLLGQMVHGQLGPLAVVKVQVKLLATALPARSLGPPAPPRMVAVYVVLAASAALGFRIARRVAAS